ncbi:MAG: NAD(P)/FAD-dependent oxidoreductase [Muribaculaceae bacterium]|nr:NAD(P)/FAD-dependent oxidoreductase [Muribaculaceae bacterium]
MGNKIIIVGSGLGGLTCGLILAREGHDVTILEQQARPGGCLQCFSRAGVKFETGMHFIGSAAPNELLGLVLRYLEVYDNLRLQPLDKDAYEIVVIGDDEFKFPQGYDALVKSLSERFPDEAPNIAALFRLIKDVANASAMHRLSVDDSDFVLTTRYQMESINSVIDQYINDPLLKRVLVGNLPLYAGIKDKTPFSTYAFITDFYLKSAYRFADGSEALSNEMIKKFTEYGGRLLTGKQVSHITCDSTHARTVETTDGSCYEADYIISTTHPARTIEWLRDTKLLRPAYRQRISGLPNSLGAFSLYLKFKPGKVPYLRSNIYEYPAGDPWECDRYTTSNWPLGYLYMHFSRDEATDTALTGVVLSYMHYDEVKQWEGTKPMRRGPAYEQFKKEHAERLIGLIEKRHPGFRDTIQDYYTSTPLTYRDYTGVEGGGMYGIAKDINLGAAGRVTHATRIPNLFLSGQNINSHGILGVIVGAVITCSEFIPIDTIFKQIKAFYKPKFAQ